MLTASVTLQGFEAVAWRDLKVIDLLCRVEVWLSHGAVSGWGCA
jgi:hypothetical protein